jgi:hypothetical protein
VEGHQVAQGGAGAVLAGAVGVAFDDDGHGRSIVAPRPAPPGSP